MAYEQRMGQGVLFQNRDKKNPKAPDWTLIRGETIKVQVGDQIAELDVAAWNRESKEKKTPFLSLSITVKH